jgi:general L-amino acid transport system permease protein
MQRVPLSRLAYEPRVRAVALQVVLAVALILLVREIAGNVAANLKSQNIASGFDFLGRTAGFEISQRLIDFTATDSYGRAFVVGLLNTLLVAAVGIVLATVLGFAIGIARLSSNWLMSRLALAYVEIVRNMPPLLTLFLIYFAFLKSLPGPRQSIALPLGAQLNVRGLYLPRPLWLDGSLTVMLAVVAGLVGAVLVARWAEARQRETGRTFPAVAASVALALGVPALAFLAAGRPLAFEVPALRGFNFAGGIAIQPEFFALTAGLTLYTAAFIAEIVRAGITGVPTGQKEAAAALGLSRGQAMRLVVLPQAMRIVIPPLTNQFLNLTKNSSLAVAIGYPDLVSVFAGTVLNNTNQAIECIAITMGVYLVLSIATALAMNAFNRRVALVER